MATQQNKLMPEELERLHQLSRIIDTSEKLDQLENIMRNHDTIIDVAKKEENWRWFKKSARDMATLFLVISAALYGAYEGWIKFIASSISKASGS